jgi:hypothetical protein
MPKKAKTSMNESEQNIHVYQALTEIYPNMIPKIENISKNTLM